MTQVMFSSLFVHVWHDIVKKPCGTTMKLFVRHVHHSPPFESFHLVQGCHLLNFNLTIVGSELYAYSIPSRVILLHHW